MTETEREEAIDELWREARNEMWLIRHKKSTPPPVVKPRMSFQRRGASKQDISRDAAKMTHELALGPDVTWEGTSLIY